MDEAEKRELTNSYVNLKEHFDCLWTERSNNIKLRFDGVADKLAETAKVIEHRLEVLNHAHEQSLEDRADFMPESKWNDWKKDFDTWKETVNKELTTINTRTVTIAAVMGIVFVLIQIVIAVWKRQT